MRDPRDLERVPVSTQARDRVQAILLGALPEEEGRALAAALGQEIRDVLAFEHEDDLEQARLRSFDLGARTGLRLARENSSLTPSREEQLVAALNARPIDWDGLRVELVPVLGPGNDDAAAGEQADVVLDVLRRWLP